MHVFGLLGMLAFAFGIVIGVYLIFVRLALGESIANRPLLTFYGTIDPDRNSTVLFWSIGRTINANLSRISKSTDLSSS
jgi:hypothetical protein